jgi:hypothetical protein
MKTTLVAMALAALALPALAQSQHYVQPHVTRNGTFVQGHMQTNPDSNLYNNWSTQGNTNPYTGQSGNVNPYQQQPQQIYQVPQPSQGTSSYGQPVCGTTASGRYVCR